MLGSPIAVPEDAGASREIPAILEASIVKKVIAYNRTIRERGGIAQVLLVQDRSSRSRAAALAAAFGEHGVKTKTINADSVEPLLTANTLVYLALKVPPAALLDALVAKQVMSVSAWPEHIQKGLASVAIGVVKTKPRIFLSRDRLRAEGQSIAAQLLSVAHTDNASKK